MYLDQAIFELAFEIEIQDAGTEIIIEYYTATEILRLLKEAKEKQEASHEKNKK